MFAIPSVRLVNLDNIVDSNHNHINLHQNFNVNLNHALYFFANDVPSKQFTNFIDDLGYKSGIQFFMINGSLIQWFFNDSSERDKQLMDLNSILSYK